MFSRLFMSDFCYPMDCSTPGFPVLHHLSELAQTHVHWVGDAIQSSCPLSSPSPLLPSIFPSIWIFSNESALYIRWPKYWSFSISPSSEYSGLISFRIDWFDLLVVQGTLKSFSSTTVQMHQFFSAQPYYALALSSVCDYWILNLRLYLLSPD